MNLLAAQMPAWFGTEREPHRAPAQPAATPGRPPSTRRRPMPRRVTVELKGEEVTLLPIADMAAAIGRSVGHVRLLESKGVLPRPRVRRRVHAQGPAASGRRWYDKRLIDAVERIALEHGIRGRRRVADWTAFSREVWEVHATLRATAGPTNA